MHPQVNPCLGLGVPQPSEGFTLNYFGLSLTDLVSLYPAADEKMGGEEKRED